MEPTYMGSGDPARRGAEAVRSIVTHARELYQYQEFSFGDQYGDNGFLELYTTQVRDQPAGVVVTVTRKRRRQGPAPRLRRR